jgi:anti-repressor protein|nr:MAG TPA: KilAC domain protein [Caudoviricetes sp.]
MEELIKVTYGTDAPTVSARDLHEGLEIKTAFKDWFPRMAEYGFETGKDFNMLKNERVQMEGNREVRREIVDYQISVDMAKQICMIQRSEKGKRYREYFLDLEKAWNTPEQVMARALKIADQQIEDLKHNNRLLEQKIEADKPKTIFADAVSTSHTSILVGDLAKLICQNGYQIGQKRLFEWLRENGYLVKGGSSKNMPMQRYVELGLFEVKESNVQNPDGSVRITRTTKVTGKGQIYFVNKFVGNVREADAEEETERG